MSKQMVRGILVFSFVLGFFPGISQSYTSEEVAFTNGDVTLSGTLSFPSTKTGPHKAIVLVSGSGPQNRDSEVVGFKIFGLLADFFNKQGFAVLRYDDRGVGNSRGKSVNESTTAELAGDAVEAFRFLRSRPDIEPTRIGLLGHSEGGVVVPIVAGQEPVSFIILMAGFGVPGFELTSTQQAAILRASGLDENFVNASVQMNTEVLKLIGQPSTTEQQLASFVETETLRLLELMPASMKSQITDPAAYAKMAASQAVSQSKSVWIRYYLSYDPKPALTKVKCPVLLLFGELDTQVTPAQNRTIMTEALTRSGNDHVRDLVIPRANHLFQEAVSGSPSEYATMKKEFAPGFLEAIEAWVKKLF